MLNEAYINYSLIEIYIRKNYQLIIEIIIINVYTVSDLILNELILFGLYNDFLSAYKF